MFTQCPKVECQAVYSVTAANLRTAMAMVRCPRCKTVFNALSTICDEPKDSGAVPIGQQLPFIQRGDRILLDREAAEKQGWYQPMPERRPKVAQTGGKPSETAPRPEPSERSAAVEGGEAASEEEPTAEEIRASAPRKRTSLASSLWGWRTFFSRDNVVLATRNLMRHRRRTALGLSAIGFGVIALILAGGFIEWNNWALRESTIQSQLGHIQVVRPGYFEEGTANPFAYLLPEQSAELTAIEAMPHVSAVAPRLAFSGLISHGETTISFLGQGVVPEKEEKASRRVTISHGENLSTGVPDGIIVGKGLAANLGVEPGDKIVMLVTPASGGMNAIEAQVRGIFYTSSKAFDDSSLRVPLRMARTLMRAAGAHSWVVLLDDTAHTDAVLDELRGRFPQAASNLQFVPWHELADFYKKVVVLFTAQVNLVRFIIALIIIVSISNTLVMGVLERTSEIGTLMAIGLRRQKILHLFVNEGLLLGVLGGVVGVVIGYGLAETISAVGIPMPPSPGMDFSFLGEIMVTWPLAIGALVLAVVSTVAASLYPAWKASRLEIVDALRHSR